MLCDVEQLQEINLGISDDKKKVSKEMLPEIEREFYKCNIKNKTLIG